MTTYKIKEFIDTEAHKIFIDRCFQRKACWSDDTCRKYIISANKKRTPYPIVVASVSSGLQHSIRMGDKLSEDRYRECEGLRKDYVSLDGQNRVEAFRKLFADELSLSGDFIDADGAEITVTNKFYSSLPIRLQDALRDLEINMSIMNSCLYSDLNDIFVNINSGDALNRQEIRNAFNTPISSFVRKISERKDIAEMWPKITGFKPPAIQRSQDAEWTAIAYMATLQGLKIDANPNGIDNFYLKGKNQLQKNIPEYSSRNQTRFSNIMSILARLCSHYKTQHYGTIPQKHFWAFLMASEYIQDRGCQVKDLAAFSKFVVKLDEKLSNKSHKKFMSDHDKWEKTGLGAEPSKSRYYYHWQGEIKKYSCRSQRKQHLIKELNKSVEVQKSLEIELI